MKLRLTLAMAAFGLTALPLPAQTGTPSFDPLAEFDNLPKMIRIQVEFIELPHPALTALMDSEAAKSDNALRKAVAAMIKAGKAEILETQMCTARSGNKAITESIEEFIYPTEYEPAELPNELHTTTDGEKATPDIRDYATGPTPTAFETRNLGSTLEIEPILGADSRVIDVRFAPEIVYHVRNDTWAEWNGKHGKAPIKMPVMYSLRVSSSATVLDGGYRLIAALSPKGEDGFPDFDRKLMVFLRCDVVTVGR